MLLSKSPNKAFYRAFGLVIALLIIGILVLALLVTTNGPRVRHVVLQSPKGGGVSSVNQALTVVFDRPIESDDFESAVDIQPKADYTVSHRNQQLNITFDQNLLSGTDYVLTLKPLLEDDLGEQMKSEYTYKFSTAEPSFTYLERNYDRGAVDKVIEREPLTQKSYVLLAKRRIKSFARNDKYMAVVTARADNTDELAVVDIGTGEEKAVDLPSRVRIDNLKFSPTDNQFAFVESPLPATDTADEYSAPSGDKLYLYNADDDQMQPIVDLNEGSNITNLLYSRNGQALLYQTLDNEYYLAGVTQTTEPILLGRYGYTGGFDQTNTRLTFLSGSDAMIYDAQAKEEQEVRNIRVGGRISTPIFLHNSDELLYLRNPIGESTLQIYTASADGDLEEQAVDTEPSAHFIADPVVSDDDRYVLIQATFEPQGSDDYAGNSKPKDARLVLYDRFEGKVLDSGTTRGVDPVWNR